MPKKKKCRRREVSSIRGWRTKREKEKLVHQDVVRGLQSVQEFEDQLLEMGKYVDIKS
jgi:hypothetical protein